MYKKFCPAICFRSTDGSRICSCQNGFQVSSTNPDKCEDIDECLADNGDCPQECKNLPGSFECGCHQGFHGHDCEDVDECMVNNGGCQHFCNNTIGSFTCSCKSGYEIAAYASTYCADKNECDMENGGCSHSCVNTDGGYECKCPEGFQLRKDGRNCKLVDKGQPCASYTRPSNGY